MTITKKELERKYYSMKNTDLAKEMNISITHLLRLIDKAGIKKKGPGNRYDRDNIKVVD